MTVGKRWLGWEMRYDWLKRKANGVRTPRYTWYRMIENRVMVADSMSEISIGEEMLGRILCRWVKVVVGGRVYVAARLRRV